jgi:hypothetical protein
MGIDKADVRFVVRTLDTMVLDGWGKCRAVL